MLTVAAMAGADLAAGVLAGAGIAKIREPAGFAAFTASLGLRVGTAGARTAGVAELGCAVAVAAVGGRTWFALLAGVYAALAVVSGLSVARAAPSCGCFGAASAPPSLVHVVVNGVSAAIALLAVLVVPAPLTDVLAAQPLAGVPYLVMVAVGAWLVVVLDTTGAQVAEQLTAVSELGPTFRAHAATPATVPHAHSHDHGARAPRRRTGGS
jgi:hypothetical protein